MIYEKNVKYYKEKLLNVWPYVYVGIFDPRVFIAIVRQKKIIF